MHGGRQRSTASFRSRSRSRRRAQWVVATLALVASVLGFAAVPTSAQAGLTVILDTGGHDQIDQGNGAQQDIAGVGIDGGDLVFAWDEPTLSGNNSSDVCHYWQEPDGTVTSLCYSVIFDDSVVPTYLTEWEVLDCGTTYGGGKCVGNNPTSSNYEATCSDPIEVAPYFAGLDTDNDLQASCTLTGMNGASVADLQYINTCTKPSASASSLSNDCIFDAGSDPAFLSLAKVVVDGPASPADFTLTATRVGSNPVESVSGAGSVATTPVTAGDYALTESSALITDGTYQLDSIVCTDGNGGDLPVVDGVVALPELASVSCVYENSVAFTEDAQIAITKSPATQTVVSGGTAEFVLAVTTGAGNVALTNVVVADPQCSTGPTFTGGDTNGDGSLDLDETWTYSCSVANVTEAFTNTATATGTAPGGAMPTASATASVDVAFPSISIDKSPDDAVIRSGDSVTFTIVVENTGEVALSAVTVSDPLVPVCDRVIGDLAPGQVVSYDCTAASIERDLNNVASVSGDPGVGDPVTDSDNAPVDVVNPSITIEKLPPTSVIRSGDSVTFTILVENTGDIALSGVTVSDPLVPACDRVIGDLAVGRVFDYQCTATDVDADFTNVASVTGDPGVGDPVTDSDSASVDVIFPSVSIEKSSTLDLAVVAPVDRADVGDRIDYTFTVANTGDSTLTNVAVSDPLPGLSAISCDGTTANGAAFAGNGTGELASGDSVVCSASYTLTQDDVNNESKTNTATVTGEPPVGDEVSDTDENTQDVPGVPDIALAKTAGQIDTTVAGPTNRADEGDTITYTFTITNTGNQTLTGAALTDALVGLDGADCGALTTLQPGDATTCQATHALTQAEIDSGAITNNAEACADTPDADPAEVCDPATTTTPIPQVPGIEIAKSGVLNVAAGEFAEADTSTITYTFDVVNTGNVTLTDVTVSDPLLGGEVCVIASLAPGGSDSCSADYTVDQIDVDAGVRDNTATATGTPPPSFTGDDPTDSDDESVDIPRLASLSLDKTGTLQTGADGIAQAGESIGYTFDVSNTGNVTLTDVTVSDDLVAGIDCGDGTATIATLAAGETVQCTGSITLDQADIDGGVFDNTAAAEGTPPGGFDGDDVVVEAEDPGDGLPDDSDSDSVVIPRAAAHEFTKAFASDSVKVGETSSFDLVYTNTGNVTLSNVDIVDDVDTLLDVTAVSISNGSCSDADGNDQTVTCSVDSLAPGDSTTVTVDFLAVPLLDQLQPDTGETSGANYVFYFENGYVLYGSTEAGSATLIGPDGAEVDSGWSVQGANQDIIFNAPDGDSFNLHLSCSEVFIDGYGVSGPTLADNPAWRIDAYQVDRFNTQGNFKDCGQFFAPFDVTNTAAADADAPWDLAGFDGRPFDGAVDVDISPIGASDELSIINPAPIEVTRKRVRRGQVEVQYFNTSQAPLEIDIIQLRWDDGSVLESATYRDGQAILIGDGTSPVNSSVDGTVLGARTKDWLRLQFDCGCAPDGLTIVIVASDGSTLEYTY